MNVSLPACETVSIHEQQRRKAVPLQDHRVSSHQLPGMTLPCIIKLEIDNCCAPASHMTYTDQA